MKSCHEYGKQETIIHTLTWSVLFTKNIIFACLMFIQRMYMSNYEPHHVTTMAHEYYEIPHTPSSYIFFEENNDISTSLCTYGMTLISLPMDSLLFH